MSDLRTIAVVGLLAAGATGACRKNDAHPEERPALQGDVARPGNLPSTGSASPAPLPANADPGPRESLAEVDRDLRELLKERSALGAKPLATLTAEDARRQPTLADAARAVLQRKGKSTAPEAVAKIEDRTVETPAGALPVRIYTPKEGEAPYPVALYYHGGGFVLGNLDSYDSTPRALANEAEAIFVSVEYRKAPEHPFPAAHEDAYSTYQWVLRNAASFGGNPKLVAVTGESAGANLAANVAITARDKGEPLPVHVLLVYPIASSDMSSPSYRTHENAQPLDKQTMAWFFEQYLKSAADKKDPRIDLVNAKLNGLPPTTIVSAEIDPLYSDAKALELELREAGVVVENKTYADMTHGFFGLVSVLDEAEDAVDFASSRLEETFDKRAAREAAAPKR